MSLRKRAQIAGVPELPTIKDYFGMMAAEQAEDIRRLKQAAKTKHSKPQEMLPIEKMVPNPWLLHPIRSAQRPAAKAGAKSAVHSAPRKAAKKVARKASKKTRR